MAGSSTRVLAVMMAVAVVGWAGPLPAQDVRARTFISKDASVESLVKSLTPVAPGDNAEASVVAPITFEFDSASLTKDSQALLDRIAAALTSSELTPFRFVVEGHTDTSGPDAYNQVLSERRSVSVLAYLADRGVAPTRLQAIGHGESRPLPDMAPGDARNRRVEVVRVP